MFWEGLVRKTSVPLNRPLIKYIYQQSNNNSITLDLGTDRNNNQFSGSTPHHLQPLFSLLLAKADLKMVSEMATETQKTNNKKTIYTRTVLSSDKHAADA